MKTILAVGAHTGDAQLTSGLLLARCAQAGDRIVTLDLTAGERGAPKGMSTEEFRQQNIASAKAFADMLGGVSIVWDTPDGELDYSKELAVKICDVMREYQVSTVLYHWKNSMHKDHIAASRLTTDAIFYASLPTFERPLPPAPIRRMLYAENWEDSEGFVPYAYFDVSEAFPLWKDAVRKLYLTEHSRDFKYLQYYEGLARMRGALIKKEYGTAFAIDDYAKRIVMDPL
ncbi:MAG: PIG-L family deacetylase [Clostridia bacterium]|nr:PIG-L family deacetylase [Clostridia bacterium]MBQ2949308.1 PIG-L family deacetylase [Clostridia bacterium]MBQ4608695.1 PIG-L family deacetylase [Clostridia bacterium]MBQ7052778.1 PIG-L family deacetylase [Clostridia bacterium]